MASPTRNPISTAPSDQSVVVNPLTGKASTWMKQWMRQVKGVLAPGITLTGANIIVLTKLTVGGTNGSIQVVNGIVTQYTPPT